MMHPIILLPSLKQVYNPGVQPWSGHALVKFLGWCWAEFILGQEYYAKPYLAQPGQIGCYLRVWPYSRAPIR